MVQAVLSVVVVVALVILVGWLTRRAWGSRRAFVKWPGVAFGGLLTAIFAIVAVVAGIGFYRLNAPHTIPASSVHVTSTPEQLARGQRLANMCMGCHSVEGKSTLDGGRSFFGGAEGPPFGTLVTPNLTPGGPLKDWSDGEIIRAIREGVDKNGRPLLIMPAEDYRNMSDTDVQSVVAYLRSQPAVAHATPATQLNLLGALLVGSGMFPTSAQTPIGGKVDAPPSGPSPTYGKYLVTISGCQTCHGKDLHGGDPKGFTPVGPNLPQVVSSWTEADFVSFMRTGQDRAGRKIDPEQMPWRAFGQAYSDDELRGIYAYVHGLPLARAQAPDVQRSLVSGARIPVAAP